MTTTSSVATRFGAYTGATVAQVSGTLAMFRHFRAFLRSDCQMMRDPRGTWHEHLSKDAARRMLRDVIDTAINRKAGLTIGGRTPEYMYHRDQLRLIDISRHIRVYQFETAEVRRRFGHLLSRYDD